MALNKETLIDKMRMVKRVRRVEDANGAGIAARWGVPGLAGGGERV